MSALYNKTFDEISLGDSASLTRILKESDITVFAISSGDVNPLHLDSKFARDGFFHKIVGHGLWSAALISTILGTQLPGPGTIYLTQTLKFHRPVFLGDKITAQVVVVKKYVRKPVLICMCKCINQHGKVVLAGFAKIMAPTQKMQWKKTKLPQVLIKTQNNEKIYKPKAYFSRMTHNA